MCPYLFRVIFFYFIKFTIRGSRVCETVRADSDTGYLFMYKTVLIMTHITKNRATQSVWIGLNQAAKTVHDLVEPDCLETHVPARR